MHPPNLLAGGDILQTEGTQESQSAMKGNRHPQYVVSLFTAVSS